MGSGTGLKLVSLFVDNLPSDMDPQGMFNMFSKFGVVKHVFISFKRSKVGTRFGFVRYECIVAAKMAIQKANGVWCGNKQLKVKFADYVNGKRQCVAGDGSKPNTSNVPALKGIRVSSCRGTKSYADTVKEGGGDVRKLLQVVISDEGSEWLQRCMVVRIKSMSLLAELQRVIFNNSLQEIHFRFGGGNLILLSFPAEELLHQKFSLVADLIQGLCDDIRLWDEDLPMETSRLAWLHCYGIPFHAWNNSTLHSIGSLWGEIIRLEDNLVDSPSLNCGKVLIHTRSMEIINTTVEVQCKNRTYKVSVGEGLNSADFDREMRQKWGFNISSPSRSESSVAGANHLHDARTAEVDHTAAVDLKQHGNSLEEVEHTVAADQKQHGNSVLVASDLGHSFSVVKDTLADCGFAKDVGTSEGQFEQSVVNVRQANNGSDLGFMRSFSGSIGPCHGLNLEIVLKKPTVLDMPQPVSCCLIEEIEGNGLMVNGPVDIRGAMLAEADTRTVDITGEGSVLANTRAMLAEADTRTVVTAAQACAPAAQDDDISSSSSMGSKPQQLHTGLDSRMDIIGSKAPRISVKGKSKNKSHGQRVKNQNSTVQKGATLRAAVAAFSLASASHAGPSKGQIILDEAQATIRMGELLGINFEGQEDDVLKKIMELEELDAERAEQRKKPQAR